MKKITVRKEVLCAYVLASFCIDAMMPPPPAGDESSTRSCYCSDSTGDTLFIANLTLDTTEQQVMAALNACLGENVVAKVQIPCNEMGRSRGLAFVTLTHQDSDNVDAIAKLLDANSLEVNGRITRHGVLYTFPQRSEEDAPRHRDDDRVRHKAVDHRRWGYDDRRSRDDDRVRGEAVGHRREWSDSRDVDHRRGDRDYPPDGNQGSIPPDTIKRHNWLVVLTDPNAPPPNAWRYKICIRNVPSGAAPDEIKSAIDLAHTPGGGFVDSVEIIEGENGSCDAVVTTAGIDINARMRIINGMNRDGFFIKGRWCHSFLCYDAQ
jgi:hypothetical protein